MISKLTTIWKIRGSKQGCSMILLKELHIVSFHLTFPITCICQYTFCSCLNLRVCVTNNWSVSLFTWKVHWKCTPMFTMTVLSFRRLKRSRSVWINWESPVYRNSHSTHRRRNLCTSLREKTSGRNRRLAWTGLNHQNVRERLTTQWTSTSERRWE